ncbi:helix-turn-helix domain-containing protein [Streptomyces sp. NPDC059913]|uniref:helix-turn-helix domain-containing protein n=1 Tax=unclassified Streptomyces TaxID=2593676 RepID=UPI003646F2F0
MSDGHARSETPLAQAIPGQEPHTKPEAAARLLGDYLRNLRKQRGMTLAQVAPAIRGSESKISRLERGESPAKERDVRDLADFYGLEDRRELDNLLRYSQDSTWYQKYADITPNWLKRLIGLEGSAESIRTYENNVVPGLLQTRSYARAVVTDGLPGASQADIDRRVELRAERQIMLQRRRRRPQVTALLNEGVLCQPTGGPQVMVEQLEHLKKVQELDMVNVLILPFERAAGVALSTPITQLTFKDGGPQELIYVELIDSAMYISRPAQVAQYRSVLNRAAMEVARHPESIKIIDAYISYYRDRAANRSVTSRPGLGVRGPRHPTRHTSRTTAEQ